jgi:hypothetical protein
VCARNRKRTRWKSHLLEINERRGGHVAQKIKKLVPERRGEENLHCEDCKEQRKIKFNPRSSGVREKKREKEKERKAAEIESAFSTILIFRTHIHSN